MNAEEFQEVAVQLLRKPGGGYSRSAVSRSYYALFHVAKRLLESRIRFTRDKDAHAWVPRLLGYATDEDVKDIGSELANLRGRRRDADYDLSLLQIEDRSTAQHEVSNAGLNMVRLKAIAGEPRWNHILADIKKQHDQLNSGTAGG